MPKQLNSSSTWWTHRPAPGLGTMQKANRGWFVVKLVNGKTFYLQGKDSDFESVYWVTNLKQARCFKTLSEAESYTTTYLSNYSFDDILQISR